MTRRTYWWEDEPEPEDDKTQRERVKQEKIARAMHRLELAYNEYRERNKETVTLASARTYDSGHRL